MLKKIWIINKYHNKFLKSGSTLKTLLKKKRIIFFRFKFKNPSKFSFGRLSTENKKLISKGNISLHSRAKSVYVTRTIPVNSPTFSYFLIK